MELIHDVDRFEKLQEILVRELVEQIRFKLSQAGITGDQLREATGEVAFSLASTIDDTAMIERDGVEVHPYLMFAVGEDQLVHCGENSNAHEFVAGIMGKVFSEKES
jgi:hypothetical protein